MSLMQGETKNNFFFAAKQLGYGLVLAVCAGCFRNPHVTAVLHVPDMRCDVCAEAVQEAFSGIDRDILLRMSADPATRRLTVVYDSQKTALRNLQHQVAEAGFDCDDIPAYPGTRDRLPDTCRCPTQE